MMIFGGAVLDHDILTVDKACFFQPLARRGQKVRGVRESSASKETDHRNRLLRPRHKRPRSRTCKARDEFPPLHSITSSARTSSVGGTSRPSAFAAFRLRVVSYLVGACTGRSAGL